jgi:drug/metabolite transporter (DMT)-like permease
MAWGMQQAAIKLAAPDVSPMLQVALRSGIAALLVLLYARFFSRGRWQKGTSLFAMSAVGLLFAFEFLFMAQGLKLTTTAHMAVLIYTAPLFAALGLHFAVKEERLGARQWSGVGLAFAGIAISFLGPDHGPTASIGSAREMLIGDLMGLGAGLAWGMTTVVIRTTSLSEAPAAQTLFYQLGGAFLALFPLALLMGDTHFTFTAMSITSLAFQALIVSFASYLLWFILLRRYYAAKLGVLVFMTPIFGVLIGVAMLKEQPGTAFFAGSIVTLAGLLLVTVSRTKMGQKALKGPAGTSEGATH